MSLLGPTVERLRFWRRYSLFGVGRRPEGRREVRIADLTGRRIRRRQTVGWWVAVLVVALALVGGSVPQVRRASIPVWVWVDSWRGVGQSLSIYEPSSWPVVDAVMEGLEVGADDFLVDIGSGDGRMVIAAAMAGARALGIERQEALVARSRENARMAAVESRVDFVHADALTLPSLVSQASVVVVFLTTQGLEILVPWLEDGVLAPGTRVVSNTWPVPGWRPSEVRLVTDGVGTWPLYFYRFPARDAYVEKVHGRP